MKNTFLQTLAALGLGISLVLSQTALADPFAKGSKRVGVTLGSGSSFNEDYLILGVGGGYFVTKGLELGLEGQAWLNGDPSIYEITPTATYIVTQLGKFKPYAGVLYKQTFIDGLDDQQAYGGRAGVILDATSKMYVRAGVVQMKYQDCTETRFVSCTETYPELALMFSL
ncbi:hypothetical protein [Agaribacterium sp. ZY112]|uniref:hypothetical protein n=1 Tax=Agaribacterium sp. ZY112 TaxID=3233574 RepID=UPI00352552F7